MEGWILCFLSVNSLLMQHSASVSFEADATDIYDGINLTDQAHIGGSVFSNSTHPVSITEQYPAKETDANKTTGSGQQNGTWNLIERVRVFKTHEKSFNWSARFDDRDADWLLTVVISAYHSPGYYGAVGFPASSSPITSAMEDFFQQNSLLHDYYIDLIFLNNGCQPRIGVPSHLKLHEQIHTDVIIGLGCSPVMTPLGYFLSYKDIPVISNFANDPSLNDKTVYDTLVRMSFTAKYMGQAVYELFSELGWTRVGAFTMRWKQCAYATQAIRDVFMARHVLMTEWAAYDYGELPHHIIVTTLATLKRRARVIILCLPSADLLRVIDEMDRQDMVSPHYVYLHPVTNIDGEYKRLWTYQSDNLDSETIERRKNAFQYIKLITLPDFKSDEYTSIQDEFFVKNQLPPFNWDLTGRAPLRDGDVMALYDIAYSWLTMVNQSLTDGTDYRSGRNIFAKARNITFPGITGDVVMDEDADRITPYYIWQYVPGRENMTKVLTVTTSNPEGQRVTVIQGESVHWGTKDGLPPSSEPECGFYDEFCQQTTSSSRDVILISSLSGAALLLIASYLITIYVRKKKYEDEINRMTWKVNVEEIVFATLKSGATVRQSVQSGLSLSSDAGKLRLTEGQVFTPTAVFKGLSVAVKKVTKPANFSLTKQHMVELKQVKDLSHENVNSFIGACVNPPTVCILTNYCSKGNLQNVLDNDDIKLDREFKNSLISDLANGMKYLHGSALVSHGSLSSWCCLIDSRWLLKVGNVGLQWLRTSPNSTPVLCKDLLWTAPELLRADDKPAKGTQKGDVYSFAIILQEILFREPPFGSDESTPEDIVKKVGEQRQTPYRPQYTAAPPDAEPGMLELMAACWQEEPAHRPSFTDIKRAIVRINMGKKLNIVDSMVQKLEKYANNLEEIVAKRTEQLVVEKKKTDLLLYRMLPEVVAEKLKGGGAVPPELYTGATVYFSDIVGFTSLSSQSSPMQVVDLLNDLYTCFDDVIALHDVYKVETIGDAYMCVSGIPVRNGERHAAEIANMALELRDAVDTFQIRHNPDQNLQVRIGIHTGPCAAGVVGLTMPRYCLFGDTVNTASRMESNSLAMKIHLSECTANALTNIGGYVISCRGRIEVKGKGLVTTFWLEDTMRYEV